MAKRIRMSVRDGGRRVACTRDAGEKSEVALYRGEQYVAKNVPGNDGQTNLVISEIIYAGTKGKQETVVANYLGRPGYTYVAEQSGEDLVIYAIRDDDIEGGLEPGGTLAEIIRHTSEQLPAGSANGRTTDRKVKDHLRSIRDTQNKMQAMNRNASDFWKRS